VQARLDRLGIRSRMEHRPRALAAASFIMKARQLFTGFHCTGALPGGSRPSDSDSKNDGPAMRRALGCRAQQLFIDGDYEELDATMRRAARSLADLPDGSSSYEGLVRGLSDLFDGRFDPEQAFAHTADWRRAVKNSVIAELIEAMLLRDWGWSARGTGYANTVSAQNMAIYSERTEMAATALAELTERASDNPLWYTLSLDVGLDQAKDRDTLRNIFDRGIEKAPDYLPLYRAMLRILMPRWGGSFDEVDRFIDQMQARNARDRGYERYAQLYAIYAWLEGDTLDLFADTGAGWSGMKLGFAGLTKRYPQSDAVLNTFANFSCRASDKDTYLQLRKAVGLKPASSVWSDKISVESCDKKLGVTAEEVRNVALTPAAVTQERVRSLGGIELGMTLAELQAAKGAPAEKNSTEWMYYSVDAQHDGKLIVSFTPSDPPSDGVVQTILFSGDEASAPRELPYLIGRSRDQIVEEYGKRSRRGMTAEGDMTFRFPNGLYVITRNEKVYRYGVAALNQRRDP